MIWYGWPSASDEIVRSWKESNWPKALVKCRKTNEQTDAKSAGGGVSTKTWTADF